ncbi:replicating factor [carnivorous sponge associated iridovirus]|jgi:hypothetical protein|nr:replicating factor [carnivorous sponge associated iridovirus]
MSINILSLNSAVLKRMEKEETVNEEKIQLLDTLLQDTSHHLDPSVYSELQTMKTAILHEKKTSRALFFARTHTLIDEYTSILKKPISHIKEDNLPILRRKNELIIGFLDIVRQVAKSKDWSDLDIPDNPEKVDNIDLSSYCPSCENTDEDRFEIDDFNRKTCLNCSTQQYAIETGITHKDYTRVNIVGKFIYNRVLHFQDCIKQYQGKQNCKIPDKLYQDLDGKFIAYRLLITNTANATGTELPNHIRYSKITRNHIIMFLKELKYTKHYENVNLIYFTLTSKRVDDISHIEDKLVDDFKELVSLYDEIHGKDKPEELDRKNFMNVQYLLFQLLRKHGHPCNIGNFTILKTVDRKLFHDTICKNLFDKLGWKFTPTF